MNTIIFDFDGTLADTVSLSHQVMNELALKYQFRQLSEADVRRLKEVPAKQVLKFMGISPLKVPFVMAAGKRKIFERIDKVPFDSDFKRLLERFKDCRLGIVSTNAGKNVRSFLSNHQVSGFDFIYADARLSGKAGVLKKALKRQNCDKTKTVYVGDEIRDIAAAHKAGLKVIAVSWGYNTKGALEAAKPDYLVDDINGLDEALGAFFNFSS